LEFSTVGKHAIVSVWARATKNRGSHTIALTYIVNRWFMSSLVQQAQGAAKFTNEKSQPNFQVLMHALTDCSP